jgi:hypothetical protein
MSEYIAEFVTNVNNIALLSHTKRDSALQGKFKNNILFIKYAGVLNLHFLSQFCSKGIGKNKFDDSQKNRKFLFDMFRNVCMYLEGTKYRILNSNTRDKQTFQRILCHVLVIILMSTFTLKNKFLSGAAEPHQCNSGSR